jgi:hypothetical protein
MLNSLFYKMRNMHFSVIHYTVTFTNFKTKKYLAENGVYLRVLLVDLVVTLNGENTSAKKADTFRAYGT